MSLLLDALHRASKDKEKAALAAVNAVAADSLSEGKLVSSAQTTKVLEFPDLVPMASVTEAPVPTAAPLPDPVVKPIAMAQANPLEFSLEIELAPPPVAKPPPQVEEEKPSAKAVSPALESYATTPKVNGTAAPKRLDPQAAAAAIQSAYAAPVYTPATAPTNRRPAILAGIAAVLGLAFASFGFGVWGDPEKLLGLNSDSSLVPATAALVPAAAPLVPADPASAVAVATPGAPAAGGPPRPVQEPVKPVTAAASPLARSPLPRVAAAGTAPAASSAPSVSPMAVVPGSKKTEAQPKELGSPAAPVAPVFAARARAQTSLDVGYAALLSGRFDDASRAYATALDANPGEPDALLGMAYIAHTKGQRDEAQSYYRRVLRQDPGNSVANAGLVALEAGASGTTQGERARELAFRQPESAAVQSLAATALVQEGALPDAALAFARAQALEPTNPLYTYNLAVALDKLGNFAQAAVQYERALHVNTTAPTPLGSLQVNAARARAGQLRQSLGLSPGVTQ